MRLIVATSSYPARADEAINAGVFVRDIADELAAQGHLVRVLTPDKGEPVTGSPVPVRTFAWGGGEKVLTRLNPRRPLDAIRLARLMLAGRAALKRLVAEFKADAVVAMWAIPAGFWAEGSGRPYVVWALGSDIWGVGRYPLGRAVVRRVLQDSGHLFANSLYLVDAVQQMAGRDCEFLAAGRKLPVDRVAAAPLPSGGPQLLFVGRWDRAKGVDVLLEAMDILVERLPDAHLHLFGGGPLESEIRLRAGKGRLRQSVTVYGFADAETMVAYGKACDLLVIPSRIESMPVIYSDALQCGCPVVATDVGDLGRLVRDQGTGLVCQPESHAALADALCAMFEDGPTPRDRYASAVSRAASMFDPARSAARCAEVAVQLAERAATIGYPD